MKSVYDPGLQQERTVLAWDRTGLALMVGSGLLLRNHWSPPLRAAGLVPAAIFLLGLILLLSGRPRYLARWHRLEKGEGILESGPILVVAAATALLGVTALLAILI